MSMDGAVEMRVLALSGSLREASWSTALLRAAQALAPAGVSVQILEAHKGCPLFNPDLEADPPDPVRTLRALAGAAEAVLIASPEYAHGVTGTIKNTLDWLVSEPGFVRKPVALFNPSHRAHHADAALRETLLTMDADLILDACVRIPVIGAPIGRDEIAATPAYSATIRSALACIAAHVASRRENPSTS